MRKFPISSLWAIMTMMTIVLALLVMIPSSAAMTPEERAWLGQTVVDTDRRLISQMRGRMEALLNATETIECAEEVAMSYEAFMMAHITETLIPFESPFVQNQCPREAPPLESIYRSADDLKLLYIILAHQDGPQIVRLIEALQESEHEEEWARQIKSHFVVHIDGKMPLPPELMAYATRSRNVYVMREGRVNVTWGGFSVVQATLNAMSYGFYLDLPFDRVINLSGATYPLATPRQIRETLASHPVTDELMFIEPVPNVPTPRAWHYFVECDNKLHRIARFGLPHGVPLRTGSQWFIITRNFAHYLLHDENFVVPYTAYAQHILIADENFFATILKSSLFCHRHANINYLHVKFDVWEDEKGEAADRSKCLQPDPRFCGRSPMLVPMDLVPKLMENITRPSNSPLFARKFDSRRSVEVLDEIDRRLDLARSKEAEEQGANSRRRSKSRQADVVGIPSSIDDFLVKTTSIGPHVLLEKEVCTDNLSAF